MVAISHLYNEGLTNQDEVLRLLFFLIDYNVKDRKFKISKDDNINDNFRAQLVITFLENVHDRLYRGNLKHQVFLALFQLYVLSRNYISSQLEFRVIDSLRRLYPNLSLVKRNEQNKLLTIQRLLEERDSDILASNMRMLEDRAYMSSH